MKPQVITLRTDRDAQRLHALLKLNWRTMAERGTPLDVTVTEHDERRRSIQNRFYRWRLNFIAESAWIDGVQYSHNVWHEIFREEFLGFEMGPKGKKVLRSTTDLSVSEFAAYTNKVEAYAEIELGLELPAPASWMKE